MTIRSSFLVVPAFSKLLSVMLLALLLVVDGYGHASAQTFRGGTTMMRQGGNNLNASMRGGGGRSSFGGGNSRNMLGGGTRNFGGGMRLGGGNGGGRNMDPSRLYPKVPNTGAGRSNKFEAPAFAPPRHQGVAIY